MNNFIKPGEIVTYTAPAGGVISGNAYAIGSLLVVATNTIAAGQPFEGAAVGIFALPKAGTAWAEGQLLYWDTAAGNLTTAPSATALRVGCAAAAAAAADVSGQCRLHGLPAPLNVA